MAAWHSPAHSHPQKSPRSKHLATRSALLRRVSGVHAAWLCPTPMAATPAQCHRLARYASGAPIAPLKLHSLRHLRCVSLRQLSQRLTSTHAPLHSMPAEKAGIRGAGMAITPVIRYSFALQQVALRLWSRVRSAAARKWQRPCPHRSAFTRSSARCRRRNTAP